MKRNVTESLYGWKSSSNRKPLILRGARQVGKTYLLKEFGIAAFPRCHYVNFEEDERLGRIFEQDLKPGRILDELQFYLDRAIARHLDPIQESEDLHGALSPPEGVHPERQQYKPAKYSLSSPTLCSRSSG